MRDIWEEQLNWVDSGKPFVLARVIRTWRRPRDVASDALGSIRFGLRWAPIALSAAVSACCIRDLRGDCGGMRSP